MCVESRANRKNGFGGNRLAPHGKKSLPEYVLGGEPHALPWGGFQDSCQKQEQKRLEDEGARCCMGDNTKER